MRILKMTLISLMLLLAAPIGLHAALWYSREHPASWASADWSSTRSLPPAAQSPPALIRVYSARTGRWKGIFATHSWIVVKEEGAASYERWDVVGWGQPVRRNHHAPDGRWYGNDPVLVHEVRGAQAQQLIPKIRTAVSAYSYNRNGDYRIWPGPNSNTFVAFVLASVPEVAANLPPTAIGKDFPFDGRWVAWTPSGTGFRVSLGGYAGLTLAWHEGFELNILGAVLGFDFRHPGLKLPGIGRVGV